MNRERELLERIVTAWEDDRYELGDALYPLIDDARKLLESEKQNQPEPVAYIQRDQLEKAVRAPMLCEVSPEPRQDRVGIYLYPAPRKPFVRLSEEKMKRLINENLESLSFYEIARAIEDALEARNS